MQGLCALLNTMGARISGTGRTGSVQGVSELGGAGSALGRTIIEIGTFVGLAA